MKRTAPFLLAAVLLSGTLTACNQTSSDEGPTVFEYARIDSLVFWPPTLRFARPGDSLTLMAAGFNRGGRVCAQILADEIWTHVFDDSTGYIYRMKAAVLGWPENSSCGADPGRTFLYKRVFFPNPAFATGAVGEKLYLEISGSGFTDSLRYVSGTAEVHAFNHLSSPANPQSVHGRFRFFDSTAAHPRRMVRLDAPATCEILQTAVFDRRGDTLAVRVRRIQAGAQPDSLLPACAGPRAADSIEVVFNAHRFP